MGIVFSGSAIHNKVIMLMINIIVFLVVIESFVPFIQHFNWNAECRVVSGLIFEVY